MKVIQVPITNTFNKEATFRYVFLHVHIPNTQFVTILNNILQFSVMFVLHRLFLLLLHTLSNRKVALYYHMHVNRVVLVESKFDPLESIKNKEPEVHDATFKAT